MEVEAEAARAAIDRLASVPESASVGGSRDRAGPESVKIRAEVGVRRAGGLRGFARSAVGRGKAPASGGAKRARD